MLLSEAVVMTNAQKHEEQMKRYRKARPKSQAEQDCLEQEYQEWLAYCHEKVTYQFSGQAGRDHRDRLTAHGLSSSVSRRSTQVAHG